MLLKKLLFSIAFLIACFSIGTAQVITVEPAFPTSNDEVLLTFHADQGSGGLAGYTGDVYAHTGVITNNSTSGSDWKYVISGWGVNIPKAKLTRIDTDTYTLSISPDIRSFYGVPTTETIEKMAFVFRSDVQVNGTWLEGKTEDNTDIFYDVYNDGLNLMIVQPSQPQVLIEAGETIPVEIASSNADSTVLYIDNIRVAQSTTNTLNYIIDPGSAGESWVKAIAYANTDMVADSFFYFVRPQLITEALPNGITEGVNYINDTTVVFCLLAPYKNYAFVIGDFNDWQLSSVNFMKRTPDQNRYWIEITNLEAGREYVYQYFIDGELKVADPMAHKVLDPWNDPYIPASTYPNLMPYPTGKTSGIVSVFQTAQQAFDWQHDDFVAPANEELIIYELHIRDFVATRDVKTVMDTLDYLQNLGVNAIELMPINEFEGNDSWGYNPSFYFATDKAYGTTDDYKRFIDECHRRGIAVIIDMVLNHSYGQSPLVQMYFNSATGQVTAQNPWYNQVCPHEPYCWGYDFDHESIFTKTFVDKVTRFWVEEFKVDGYRFDFTKGFSNVVGDGGAYNSPRIANLKRMADKIWEVKPETYVILEHFADNTEERELSTYGMMLWGNMAYAYNEATMGYLSNSDFSGVSYQKRGWTKPHLVGYMESHDEERQMFKNIAYGNHENPFHDTRSLNIAVKREAAAAAMFLLVPGPKMIWQFGELGYDVSIDEPCRVCPKPIRWNYLQDFDRRLLRDYYSSLIHLRHSQDVFNSTDYTITAIGAGKRLLLTGDDMSVVVLSNFDVNGIDLNPQFYSTGWWYDYYGNDSINVTDVSAPIRMEAGEFKIFTSKRLSSPTFVGLAEPTSASGIGFQLYPNPSQGQFELKLNLEQSEVVSIQLYNLSGQLLENVIEGKMPKGAQVIAIDAADKLVSGIYLVKIQLGSRVGFAKLVKE